MESAAGNGRFLPRLRTKMAFPRLYRAVAAVILAVPAQAGLNEAIAYLEDEVPRWKRENNCFSCHNNGDGARALFVLKAAGFAVKPEALADSLDNLRAPQGWEQKTLAIVQYAAAMREARVAALIPSADEAVPLLVKRQEPDGHWKVDEEKGEGAAATYGPELGTALALAVIDPTSEAAVKARRWLASRQPSTIVSAAGILLGGIESEAAARALLDRQVADGSWNHEAFDTALAMLALRRAGKAAEAIERGRAYLLKTQLSGGGWTGTTRPAGGTSYAQHISTTAWAALALAVPESR